MKVFIAGGRGRVGSRLADSLKAKGIEVVSGGLEDGIDVISGKESPRLSSGSPPS
ncbi:hypothetical protein ABZ465_08370 [Streptomyces griseoincarnatus]